MLSTLAAMFSPFIEYGFMRRALAGSISLSVAAGPLGVLLVLRRLSLMGDAMAHAILPGVAVGFLVAGMSVAAMAIGGTITGLLVAMLAGLVARYTPQREDASFAAFYLVSLGLGVMLVSLRGSNMDLLHMLFGTVLGLDNSSLVWVTAASSVTLLVLAWVYRPLVAECADPTFLRHQGSMGTYVHMIFLLLLVIMLVAGFQVLGTLMVVGIMMLPATAARFWVRTVGAQMVLASVLGAVSSVFGLVFSFYADVPASPSIIMCAGLIYFISLFAGPSGGLISAIRQARARRQNILEL